MDLRSIYIANGVGIVILLMLYYASHTKILRNRLEDRVYSAMIVGVMLACVAESATYAIDGATFQGARVLSYVLNTYLYTVNLLLSFFVLVYVDLGLYGDVRRITRLYRPQIAIACVMFVINIVNLFVPVSFYLTQDNVYHRTPISYVYYFIILYYCLTALFVSRRYERENGARAFFRIQMFLTPIIVGAGLQFMFYGLSLAWLSAALGLTGLFMMQQNEVAYIDALTGIYNRQYLNHILAAWIGRKAAFCGFMLDVDHFKAINDNYGHTEGDQALVTVANILLQARHDNEWVFRFAGDEFVVLKMCDDVSDLDAYLAEVTRLLQKQNSQSGSYQLSLSYGVGQFGANDVDGIDAFMRSMDSRMYRMKEQHHRSA